MNLGPICHTRSLNRGNLYFFKLEFSSLMANEGYGSYEKIKNISSGSIKLCLLSQKTQGHMPKLWDLTSPSTKLIVIKSLKYTVLFC